MTVICQKDYSVKVTQDLSSCDISYTETNKNCTMYGFNEWTGFASTPPKKYKVVTVAGSAQHWYCPYPPPGASDTSSMTGDDSFSDAGVETPNIFLTVDPDPPVGPYDLGGIAAHLPYWNGTTTGVNATLANWTPGVDGGLYCHATGGGTFTLSVEYTEAIAIANGAVASTFNRTHVLLPFIAFYNDRGNTFVFGVRLITNLRVECYGLNPGSTYKVSLSYTVNAITTTVESTFIATLATHTEPLAIPDAPKGQILTVNAPATIHLLP